MQTLVLEFVPTKTRPSSKRSSGLFWNLSGSMQMKYTAATTSCLLFTRQTWTSLAFVLFLDMFRFNASFNSFSNQFIHSISRLNYYFSSGSLQCQQVWCLRLHRKSCHTFMVFNSSSRKTLTERTFHCLCLAVTTCCSHCLLDFIVLSAMPHPKNSY